MISNKCSLSFQEEIVHIYDIFRPYKLEFTIQVIISTTLFICTSFFLHSVVCWVKYFCWSHYLTKLVMLRIYFKKLYCLLMVYI